MVPWNSSSGSSKGGKKWADSELTLEECEAGFAAGFDMGKRRERSLIT